MKKCIQLTRIGILATLTLMQTTIGSLNEHKVEKLVIRQFPVITIRPHLPETADHVLAQVADDVNKALEEAIEYGIITNVTECIEKGADLGRTNKHGYLPLHLAAQKGRRTVVELLLKAGATQDVVTKNGLTPLHEAAYHGHSAVVELLLTAGATQEAVTKKWLSTPLHWAASNGHRAVVELLLRNGAAKNATDKDRFTPLHGAAYHGHGTVVELLLTAGATKETIDRGGRTPLHGAAYNGHGAVVELLLTAGANKDTQDNKGWTPLHWAVENGHGTVAELLLKAGATKDTPNKDGWTPLNLAVCTGHEVVVEMLLKAGADVRYRNNAGHTPLACALYCLVKLPEAPTYPKIIHMLLLIGNLSLEEESVSLKAQDILKTWGFYHAPFESYLQKSKKLLREYSHAFIRQLESYGIPTVIAALIFGYHECLDTRMLLLRQTRPLTSTHQLRCIVQ